MRFEAGHEGAIVIPFPDAAQRRAKRFEQEVKRIVEAPYEAVSDYESGWYHTDAIDADKNTRQ